MRTENVQRGDQHWTRRDPERHAAWNATKLDAAKVRAIKRRLRAGERPYVIAKDYPVCADMIARIARGQAWKHVTIEAEAAE